MPLDEAGLRGLRQKGIVQEYRRRQARERYEGSLYAFFERAWQEIDPAPFSGNWHHEVICEQLEALARGEMRDLIINLPPRTGKTNLISVCLNAWLWCQPEDRWAPLMGPKVSLLCVSYGAVLAEVIATRARRLIMGPWYQGLWGDRVQIREDQASRADFALASVSAGVWPKSWEA